jgi:alpha-mannosidase
LAAVNTLAWSRTELVKVPQAQPDAKQSQYALVVDDGSGLGQAHTASALKHEACVKEASKGRYVLSNKHFTVEVEKGCIVSLRDLRADREVIAKGRKGNQLVIFDDKPLYWQAWDVEVFHLDSRKELESEATEVAESGPHRVSVVTKTKVSDKSWVKTTISLDATNSDDVPSYVRVQAEVEWHETMKFLKVECPVDVVNTEASYETQYGIVRRPTHYNTR